MDCLKDITCGKRTIIGIRDYDNCVTPEADLWINDLPGISLKRAASVSNEEVKTGSALLKKCIRTAIQKTFTDFDKEISPYFNFNAIVETRQVDDFSDAEILPIANLSRGLVLKRWRSEMAQIYIEEIYIKSNTSIIKEIKFYDGEELTLSLENISIEAGKIKTIRIDRKFKSETVSIKMDNNDCEVYSKAINNWGSSGCYPCNHEYMVDTCGDGYQGFVIKGFDGNQEDNLTYGIGVKASVRCYNENIICSILPQLYLPIWYKSGSEFMKELMYTDRINPITLFTADKAGELFDDYVYEYKEIYAGTAKSIQAFLRSTKGECLTCNNNYYAQVHP